MCMNRLTGSIFRRLFKDIDKYISARIPSGACASMETRMYIMIW